MENPNGTKIDKSFYFCTKDSETPMEQKLKESFYICRYSDQEHYKMNKHAVLVDFYERWKTSMEQKLKESLCICRYSTQEPGGMKKHAGFLKDLYKSHIFYLGY